MATSDFIIMQYVSSREMFTMGSGFKNVVKSAKPLNIEASLHHYIKCVKYNLWQ